MGWTTRQGYVNRIEPYQGASTNISQTYKRRVCSTESRLSKMMSYPDEWRENKTGQRKTKSREELRKNKDEEREKKEGKLKMESPEEWWKNKDKDGEKEIRKREVDELEEIGSQEGSLPRFSRTSFSGSYPNANYFIGTNTNKIKIKS